MSLENKHIKFYQLVTLISSLVLIGLILTAWVRESIFSEWKQRQKEFYDLQEDGRKQKPEIMQLQLKDLGRVDRCVSCHLGLEDPGMSSAPQPHRTHPGDHLLQHSMLKFGCTICHAGQGRAIEQMKAFGREAEFHWDQPLLSDPFIQSSCGKCHLTLFTRQETMPGTEVYYHGKEIFEQEGCLGCHKARGAGGSVGPDLTEQGEKTKHEYNFQNIRGEQSISNWLKQHFKDPETVSPGSEMLSINLPEEELEALVTFTMGLAKPDIPFDYFSIETLNEFKGIRETLKGDRSFSFACAACHGKKGEGKSYKDYSTGVPGTGKSGFIRTASPEFIKFTLNHGRGNRQMASWATGFSGISGEEIDSLVWFIKHRDTVNSDWATVRKTRGVPDRGMDLFRVNCQQCHGENGAGGVALGLSNPDFLRNAGDDFIYQTVVHGRRNTAMPSWPEFNSQEMADLISSIRSRQKGKSRSNRISLPASDLRQGALSYHYLCSRCHGEFGEGNTGPSIINRDFAQTADVPYLYNTIAFGRGHTAMFGWTSQMSGPDKLAKQDISNIIDYLRSSAAEVPEYNYAGANPGNAIRGEDSYAVHCSECHGTDGEGISAPALNNQEFLNAATNGFILSTVTLGRKETDMPPWGNGNEKYPMLDGKDRQDLVAFIRSWQKVKIKN